ncbi:MAG TPA: SRPBCC domain-containing protein [Steroidobacteraceae bacterium]|nr:SRPBCC domain-containing protein [Steroidobacteraceae bacterium]
MSEKGRLISETMIRFERRLPGPIERVWEYLTQPKHLAVWFGAKQSRYVLEPRVGGAVSLGDNGHIRGVVTQWQPPHKLVYTWNVFIPGETESRYPESYVTFELTTLPEDAKQVLLTFSHRPMLEGFEQQSMMGWHSFFGLLEQLLRGEPPESLEAAMRRNKVLYGVEEIKL